MIICGTFKNQNMNKILAILIFSLIISCGNINKNLEGVWVSTYFKRTGDNKRIPISAKKIIEFTNDSVYIRGLKNFPNNNYKGTYSLKGNKLIFDDSITSNLVNKTKDSLVIKDFDDSKMVYKKLQDTLKNKSKKKINLVDKSFQVYYQKIRDTITFSNNTVILSKHHRNIKTKWELINYKGYDFLMIDDIFYLPLIVRNIHEEKGVINCTSLHVNPESIKMIQLESIYEK